MHDGSSDYACNGWTSLFPAFSLLSSSWIPISPFPESASILHLILPLILPSPYFSPALVPHAFLQHVEGKQFMKTDMHLYSRRTEITTMKIIQKTHLLNPRPSILTTIQLLGASASHSSNLRTYSNLYRFNQIHVHSWFFVWNGTYSLLAIVAKDFQRL